MSAAIAAIATDSTNASTGPRTPEGKAIASRNSLKHGLASKAMIMFDESAEEWEELRDGMFAEWRPTTPTEESLVGDMAKHQWLKDRAIRLQNEEVRRLGVEAFNQPAIAVLMRYQTTNERAFARAIKQLENLRKNQVTEFVSQNAGGQVAPAPSQPPKERKTNPVPQSHANLMAEIDRDLNEIELSHGLRTTAANVAS